MAQFFINRPVFAWVVAITIMLAGMLGISTLSISQYPEIAPPVVRISANYPGASADTVENAVFSGRSIYIIWSRSATDAPA